MRSTSSFNAETKAQSRFEVGALNLRIAGAAKARRHAPSLESTALCVAARS
jgi:hypothetical protein